MPFELDHVFVAASPDAPEAQFLKAQGFTPGATRDHPGQGTAGRGIFFENAYLELLWLTDAEVASLAPIRRTHLAERADPARTACPFGVALRSPADPVPDPPFRTWEYSPPYLPEGASFDMGANTANLDEPLIFVLPWSRTPSWSLPEHRNGTRRITRVDLTLGGGRPSKELTAFSGLGLVSFEEGREGLMRIELDGGEQGRALDLRPKLPLILRW